MERKVSPSARSAEAASGPPARPWATRCALVFGSLAARLVLAALSKEDILSEPGALGSGRLGFCGNVTLVVLKIIIIKMILYRF